MSNINDSKIMILKQQIKDKKDKLSQQTTFCPITNCSLELDGERYNINVLRKDKLIDLMVKLNMRILSAKDLDLLEDYKISEYKPIEWIRDLSARLSIISRKDEENQLKQMESKLDKLLSDDKKVELELSEIENMLK